MENLKNSVDTNVGNEVSKELTTVDAKKVKFSMFTYNLSWEKKEKKEEKKDQNVHEVEQEKFKNMTPEDLKNTINSLDPTKITNEEIVLIASAVNEKFSSNKNEKNKFLTMVIEKQFLSFQYKFQIDKCLLPKKIDKKQVKGDLLGKYIDNVAKIGEKNGLWDPLVVNVPEGDKENMFLEIYRDDLIDSLIALQEKFDREADLWNIWQESPGEINALRAIFYLSEVKEIYEILNFLKNDYLDDDSMKNILNYNGDKVKKSEKKYAEFLSFRRSIERTFGDWSKRKGCAYTIGSESISKEELVKIRRNPEEAKKLYLSNFKFTDPYEYILDKVLTTEKKWVTLVFDNNSYTRWINLVNSQNIEPGLKNQTYDVLTWTMLTWFQSNININIDEIKAYAYYTTEDWNPTISTIQKYMEGAQRPSIVSLDQKITENIGDYNWKTIVLSADMAKYKPKLVQKFGKYGIEFTVNTDTKEESVFVLEKEYKNQTRTEAVYRKEYKSGETTNYNDIQQEIKTSVNRLKDLQKAAPETITNITIKINSSSSRIPTGEARDDNEKLAADRAENIKEGLNLELLGVNIDTKSDSEQWPWFPPTKKEFYDIFNENEEFRKELEGVGIYGFEDIPETPQKLADNHACFDILEKYMYRPYQSSSIAITYDEIVKENRSDIILSPTTNDSEELKTRMRPCGLAVISLDKPIFCSVSSAETEDKETLRAKDKYREVKSNRDGIPSPDPEKWFKIATTWENLKIWKL